MHFVTGDQLTPTNTGLLVVGALLTVLSIVLLLIACIYMFSNKTYQSVKKGMQSCSGHNCISTYFFIYSSRRYSENNLGAECHCYCSGSSPSHCDWNSHFSSRYALDYCILHITYTPKLMHLAYQYHELHSCKYLPWTARLSLATELLKWNLTINYTFTSTECKPRLKLFSCSHSASWFTGHISQAVTVTVPC